MLVGATEALERHREASLVDPGAPRVGDALELAHRLVRDVRKRLHREGVPGLLDSGHGLAHLADRAALEREPAGLDDRLVTEVEAPQAERLERRCGSRAHRHRSEPQAANLRERGGLVEQRRHRGRRPDGIAGAQHHPTFDAVPEERRAVVGEEVVLIAAELEERERVVAVPAHELLDRVTYLRIGQRPWGGQGPEHEPRRAAERNEPEQAERERQVPAFVAQAQLARLPGEELEASR